MTEGKQKIDINDKVVYISGGITDVPNYSSRFWHASAMVYAAGARWVFNPAAMFPVGWSWEKYMRIDLAVMAEADVVVMLPGWRDSRGACLERDTAIERGMPVYQIEDIIGEGVLS